MIINLDFIYPIGSIYLTMNEINPSTLFGGTWVQISQGRVLAGAGMITGQNNNTYFGEITDENRTWFWGVGTTIGEYKHKLTVDEMPKHRHSVNYLKQEAGNDYQFAAGVGNWQTTGIVNWNINDTGGDLAHSNVQPTLFCMIWQRIA